MNRASLHFILAALVAFERLIQACVTTHAHAAIHRNDLVLSHAKVGGDLGHVLRLEIPFLEGIDHLPPALLVGPKEVFDLALHRLGADAPLGRALRGLFGLFSWRAHPLCFTASASPLHRYL